MLSAIAVIPSTPVLVPELAGEAAAELTDLREAVFAAASELPQQWLAIGVGATDAAIGAQATGTFAGYGIDLAVGLSPEAHIVQDLPLCALMTAWVRLQAQPAARAEVHVLARDTDGDDAKRRGARLRTRADDADVPVGVLVVADGATTLTPPAPGGHDPSSVAVQAALDDALAAADLAALADLPSSISGRAAWHALAGLVGAAPRSTTELYRGAPYGVGYFAGVWYP